MHKSAVVVRGTPHAKSIFGFLEKDLKEQAALIHHHEQPLMAARSVIFVGKDNVECAKALTLASHMIWVDEGEDPWSVACAAFDYLEIKPSESVIETTEFSTQSKEEVTFVQASLE